MSFPLDCTAGPLFVAAQWAHNGHDVDLSAVCCDFVGNIIDVCYFKQQQVLKGNLQHSGDNRTGQGEGDDETITIHLNMLPPEVQFIFFIVNYHDGSPNNVAVRIADGAQAGGHQVTTVELDQKEAANLVAVAVRPFDQAYPPAPWTLQVIDQRGDGQTFADSHYLVEGALKGLVDAALAAERKPNDPTKHYDQATIGRARGKETTKPSSFDWTGWTSACVTLPFTSTSIAGPDLTSSGTAACACSRTIWTTSCRRVTCARSS